MQNLADVLAEQLEITAKLTPREAAERAWHPSGPPVKELTRIITANRAEAKRLAEGASGQS